MKYRVFQNARKMKQGIAVMTIMATAGVWYACNNEEVETPPVVNVETISAKWTMQSGQWESFEFYEDQTYIATMRAASGAAAPLAAKPRAAAGAVVMGTYSLANGTLTLKTADGQDFGKVEIKSMTDGAAQFVVETYAVKVVDPNTGTEVSITATIKVEVSVTKKAPDAQTAAADISGEWVCVETDSLLLVCRDTFVNYTYTEQRSVDTSIYVLSRVRVRQGDSTYFLRWQHSQWLDSDRIVVEAGAGWMYDSLKYCDSYSYLNNFLSNIRGVEYVFCVRDYSYDNFYCAQLDSLPCCAWRSDSLWGRFVTHYDSIRIDTSVPRFVWVDTMIGRDTTLWLNVQVSWDSAFQICLPRSVTTTLTFAKNGTAQLSVSDTIESKYSGYYMHPYENTADSVSVKFYEQQWHYMGKKAANGASMTLRRHDGENLPNRAAQTFVKRQ